MIYHLAFDYLPIPSKRLDELDITKGMQALAHRDKQTHTHGNLKTGQEAH